MGGGLNDLSAAGTISKLDACTGQASVFAQLPQQNTTLDYTMVSLYGSGFFYITNFEDGKIYRLDMQGNILNTFGPFTLDSGAAGFAPLGERLWAIEYNLEDNRLYYSVWTDYGGEYVQSGVTPSTIYSVVLDDDCDFIAESNQLEYDGSAFLGIISPWRTDQAHYHLGAPISDITFSRSGVMAIAQRNMGSDVIGWNHLSVTQILEKCDGTWAVTKTLIPGQHEYEGYGGVSWSHDETSIWVSAADLLDEDGPHGLMGVLTNHLSYQSQGMIFEAIAYDPSWTGTTGQDFKGIGGDIEVFKGTYRLNSKGSVSCPPLICLPVNITTKRRQ